MIAARWTAPRPAFTTNLGLSAAIGSGLPARSVARTSNVCVRTPTGSSSVVCGDEHGAKGFASSRHMNVDGSVAWNSIVGVRSVVAGHGPLSMCVSGAIESST